MESEADKRQRLAKSTNGHSNRRHDEDDAQNESAGADFTAELNQGDEMMHDPSHVDAEIAAALSSAMQAAAEAAATAQPVRSNKNKRPSKPGRDGRMNRIGGHDLKDGDEVVDAAAAGFAGELGDDDSKSGRRGAAGRKAKLCRSDPSTQQMVNLTMLEWCKIGIDHGRATWRRVLTRLKDIDMPTADWFEENVPPNTIRRWKEAVSNKLRTMGRTELLHPAAGDNLHTVEEDIVDHLSATRYSNCGRSKKWRDELSEPVKLKLRQLNKPAKDITVPMVRQVIAEVASEEFNNDPEFAQLAAREHLSDTTLRKIVRDVLELPLRSVNKRRRDDEDRYGDDEDSEDRSNQVLQSVPDHIHEAHHDDALSKAAAEAAGAQPLKQEAKPSAL